MGTAENLAGLMGIGVGQLIAIVCGCFFRCYCPPGPFVSKRRHAFELSVGIFILYIGYGPSVIHLFLQAVPAYLMLVFLPLSFAQYGILIFSMTYLSGVHIYQLMTNGENSVDISA
ncbi:hypothetical protein PHET_06338 [Paragonimus heterotremus]|uniref:Uncharacterized protein n=1 Tax=Paragonimus heterotremus TaxID=100268 RepID=A0A8J4WY63_9TREM|nr:hypothetical protein PHET_06338 [Paragonimus heterotremus]